MAILCGRLTSKSFNSTKWRFIAGSILGDFLGVKTEMSLRAVRAIAAEVSKNKGSSKYKHLALHMAGIVVAQQFPGLVSNSPTGRKRRWNALNSSFALLEHERGKHLSRQRLSDARSVKKNMLAPFILRQDADAVLCEAVRQAVEMSTAVRKRIP